MRVCANGGGKETCIPLSTRRWIVRAEKEKKKEEAFHAYPVLQQNQTATDHDMQPLDRGQREGLHLDGTYWTLGQEQRRERRESTWPQHAISLE